MENEIWKDVPGYEGFFQASDNGRIKSVRGIRKQVLANQRKGTNARYFQIKLCKKGKCSSHLVHRIIALAFIPNPDNKQCVNHKDGNGLNNHISNLEWCTYRENHNHAVATGLMEKIGINKGRDHRCAKPVLQFTMDGEFIKEWPCIIETKSYGFIPSAISSCCSGTYKYHKGYKWELKHKKIL